MKKRYSIPLLIVVLTLGAAFFHLKSKKAVREGKLSLSGLKTDVSVQFDRWGVPHIEASNELDGYRVLGYLHAQDRLFQMEVTRRLGRGELAEIIGEKLLPMDRFFRTIGVARAAKEFAAKQDKNSPAYQKAKAYYDGINEFQRKGPTPIEFEVLGIKKRDFTIEDGFCIGAVIAHSFAKGFRTDPLLTQIRDDLGPEYLEDLVFKQLKPTNSEDTESAPTESQQTPEEVHNSKAQSLVAKEIVALSVFLEELVPAFGNFEGSNGWIIGPKLSASGAPILVGDPHIAFFSPSTWWEAQLRTPQFEIYGHYLAGIPFALLGQTPDAAWTLTMFQNDDVDFYQEKLLAASEGSDPMVLYQNQWMPLKTVEEQITVKGRKEKVTLKVSITNHGPIVNGALENLPKDAPPISLWWRYLDPNNGLFSAYHDLERSKTTAEVHETMRQFFAPGLNLLYATKQGEIAWWALGQIPIRPQTVDSNFILNGYSGENENLGYQNFDRNPHLINPVEGMITSANHDPGLEKGWNETAGYYNQADRIERIRTLLQQAKRPMTASDMAAMQLDHVSDAKLKIRDRLLAILEGEELPQQEAFLAMKQWQGEHDVESIGPTLFYQWEWEIVQRIFVPKLGKESTTTLLKTRIWEESLTKILYSPHSLWWGEHRSPESQKKLVREAWMAMLKTYQQKLGQDPKTWHWGKMHTLEHVHALGRAQILAPFFNVGPFPTAGGHETIDNKAFVLDDANMKVVIGPSTRRVIDFGDPEHSLGINPTGQSGYFLDEHYQDQALLYNEGKTRTHLINPKEVTANRVSVLLIVPSK